MSLIKTLAGETAVYGLSFIVGRVLNWIVLGLYLTHRLDTFEYGLYNEMYFYVALALILLVFRLETTSFRYARQEGEESVFGIAFGHVATLGSALLAFVLWWAPTLSTGLGYGPDASTYLRLLGWIVWLDALMAIPFARLRYRGKALRFAVLKIAHILIHTALVLLFFEMPWSEILSPQHVLAQWKSRPLIGVFGANLVASAVITMVMLRDMPLVRRTSIALWQKMMRYAAPLVWVALAGVLNQYAYTVLIKYGLGGDIASNVAAMGVYSAAFKLSLLLALFTTAFNYAAEPFFFRQMHRHDRAGIYADVARAYALTATAVITALLFTMDVLQYLLGSQYRQGLYLAPVLLGAFYFLGLYYNFSVWYKITDRTHYGAIIATVGVAITFGMGAWWIPRIGMAGAAWATLACYSAMATLAWWWGRRYLPIPYAVGRFLLWLLASYALYYLWQGILRTQVEPFSTADVLLRMGCLALFALALWRIEGPWLTKALRRT